MQPSSSSWWELYGRCDGFQMRGADNSDASPGLSQPVCVPAGSIPAGRRPEFWSTNRFFNFMKPALFQCPRLLPRHLKPATARAFGKSEVSNQTFRRCVAQRLIHRCAWHGREFLPASLSSNSGKSDRQSEERSRPGFTRAFRKSSPLFPEVSAQTRPIRFVSESAGR